MKVGVIGNGFVGEAQAFAFSLSNEVLVYDIDPKRSVNTLEEVHKADFVFVCVPTPMFKDGRQDTKYIDSVFTHASKGPIYIIKSTVLPGTTASLQKKYPHLNIVFSPEFLTERIAKLDMMMQARIIFGGDKGITTRVQELYEGRFMNRHFIHTDTTTAEFIKYMNNCFFATKVSLLNEYHRLGETLGIDWRTAMHGFAADGRVGDSHMQVPGPDGKLGFGGACFPKDINAFITLANDNNVDMNVLEAAWKTNLEVRPEADWNEIGSRAVSK
jgi:nucleotide sugar dehydrogenase